MGIQKKKWYVYILECSDESLYTGVTTDLERRVEEHNTGHKKAAKFTRTRRPVKLVWWAQTGSKSEAYKQEALIKKMPRKRKLQLIEETYVQD